ncbi:hypothetical protein M3Y97_00774500 [Aphelenchoides bicaudatus]|nr:hypothetical protein M3Y97_00774500 [Aphelenchoides bicaudatus]
MQTRPTDSQCFDLGTNCEQLRHLCKAAPYFQFLEDHCPRSCGSCTDSGETCIDNRRECEYWALNGFCSSAFFSVAERQRYCARTCQLCNI